ncbi:MAG: hypothetical protein ACEPOV_10945 [Hyphomicrobiales bacterium]
MSKFLKTLVLVCFVCLFGGNAMAQTFDANRLPKYIVITAENTKLFGGINPMIDAKKSPHKEALRDFEDYIVSKRTGAGVRNLTDLLNVMDGLGFDYIDSFNADSSSYSDTMDDGDGFSDSVSDSKFRVNLVFKKRQ